MEDRHRETGWRDEALALLETRDGTLDCTFADDVTALADALQRAHASGLIALNVALDVGAEGNPLLDGIVVDPRNVVCTTASRVSMDAERAREIAEYTSPEARRYREARAILDTLREKGVRPRMDWNPIDPVIAALRKRDEEIDLLRDALRRARLDLGARCAEMIADATKETT